MSTSEARVSCKKTGTRMASERRYNGPEARLQSSNSSAHTSSLLRLLMHICVPARPFPHHPPVVPHYRVERQGPRRLSISFTHSRISRLSRLPNTLSAPPTIGFASGPLSSQLDLSQLSLLPPTGYDQLRATMTTSLNRRAYLSSIAS